ncbi:MAG: xanthine dehydrogenase family protein subunit M [Bacteroidota bacterium]
MPILHNFEYFKPASLNEALLLLSRYKRAYVLAGGTDLVNNLKSEIDQPDAVVDIKSIKTLHAITFKKNVLTIGACVTFSELIDSKIIQSKFPVIAEVAKTVGSVGIRNRATMVGNICSAVACADSSPMLLAFRANVLIQGKKGKRKVAIEKWFKGNKKTDLKIGELVTAIEIPFPAKNYAGCFVKLGRYSGEDLAQASVVVLAFPKNQFAVAFGSVGPIPIMATKIANALKGRELSQELIKQASALIPTMISPITDMRATKEYRMHMCQVIFERGLKAASDRLRGDGPAYGVSLI